MAFNFKVKRNITLPLLKLEKNNEYYVKFDGPMFLGKEINPGKESSDVRKQAATLANVVNLETGELCQIICPLVLQHELNDAYPGEGYVGLCFAISLTRPEGKAYNLVQVTEIEPSEAPGASDESDFSEVAKSTPKSSKARK